MFDHRRRRASSRPLLVVSLLSAALALGPASSAGSSETAPEAVAPSPVLIEQAVDAGALDPDTGLLYLAYALTSPDLLPAEYRSDVPYHATLWLLKLHRGLERMEDGATKSEIESVLAVPTGPGTSFCQLSPPGSTDVLETEHFRIEYNAAEVDLGPDGLTVEDYAESLEGAWQGHIDAFGWAAPPVHPTNPWDGRYLVKISNLSPVVYGYVSNFGTSAGLVADNPNTPWTEDDAYASCMGLNTDYVLFPGSPRRALDATTAHEFNHSIQFGLGALHHDDEGAEPDDVFVEGGATWMEDENYDGANDNYNYLWPRFHDDMGDYGASPYPYWITFRGLTERYGASIPGGGENVMQEFWEITSREEAHNLAALDLALRRVGRTTLADAYHAYAIAVKFNRACGGGYAYPHCFEEGPQYVNGDGVQEGAGQTAVHATIASVGGSVSRSLPDNYALNWVQLPTSSGKYRVTLANTSTGGALRLSVVCDTGAGFRMQSTGNLGPGASKTLGGSFAGCASVVAVITNLAQTAANPSSSANRSYTLTTAP